MDRNQLLQDMDCTRSFDGFVRALELVAKSLALGAAVRPFSI
jgi:hypothetical protein